MGRVLKECGEEETTGWQTRGKGERHDGKKKDPARRGGKLLTGFSLIRTKIEDSQLNRARRGGENNDPGSGKSRRKYG